MNLARPFKAGNRSSRVNSSLSDDRKHVVSPVANTYTSLHYHFTFSTKNREPWIVPKIENRVWAYIGGIARKHKMTAIQLGGIEDHIHALVLAPPILAPSQIAQYLKGDSSKWIHEEFPNLRAFAWQDGYGDSPSANPRFPT
jgi:REP element-mobilizing transposase RayT